MEGLSVEEVLLLLSSKLVLSHPWFLQRFCLHPCVFEECSMKSNYQAFKAYCIHHLNDE